MFVMNFLEVTGSGAGSIWVPIIVLGWFAIMTLVGWQVSRRNTPTADALQDQGISPAENPPSEFDDQ